MDFGRLSSVDGLELTLPDDDPATARVLAARPRSGPARVYCGGPRWADRGYLGRLYPPRTPASEFLGLYGRSFTGVELNATFYRADPAQLATWAAAVPPTFRFSPKIPKQISHVRQLVDVERELESFRAGLRALGSRLGLPWLLLPPGFGPDRLPTLTRFLERWGDEVRLGVELRHRDWFADPGARCAVFDLLEHHGAVAVLTDVAGRRDVLHQRLTAPVAMLRFTGNRLHPSDFSRLDAWVDRLGSWVDQGLETLYLFLHQPEEHLNLDLAAHVLAGLSVRTGLDLKPPRPEAAYGPLFG